MIAAAEDTWYCQENSQCCAEQGKDLGNDDRDEGVASSEDAKSGGFRLNVEFMIGLWDYKDARETHYFVITVYPENSGRAPSISFSPVASNFP